VGGSIQFTAVDPFGQAITYSLPVTREGITVNPSTGLVTVAATAAGTSGSITVRATDTEGLSANASCTVTVASAVTGDWQLASANYVPAKMPAVIVHPRPDAETQSWERHRLAPEGIAWSIPIAVQGGSWPFKYEVVSGPTGMTIGEQYGQANYGVLSWPSPSIGTHTVTVRVRTQEEGRNTSGFAEPSPVTFTLEVAAQSDSRFIILNGGTLASALDAASAARQLFLRAGTYTTDSAAQFQLDGTRPSVIVGYPNEAVTISYTQRNFAVRSGAWLSDLALDNAAGTYSTANIKALVVSGRIDRLTTFRVQWNNWASRGTALSNAVDNPACLDIPAPSAQHNYLAMVGCSLSACVLPLVDAYRVNYAVIENNVCDWTTSFVVGKGIFPKNADNYWTIRANTVSGSYRNPEIGNNASDALIALYLNPYQTVNTSGNVEACFNSVRMNLDTDSGISVGSGTAVATGGPVWQYRNTIYGYVQSLSQANWTHHVENDVVVKSTAPQVSANVDSNTGTECQGTPAQNIVDANNILTGTYAAYRGLRGHEIA
jgi:hypothetical protein